MTTGMLDTNQTRVIATPDVRDENLDVDGHAGLFQSLSKEQKRFHILFYALAGLTGILAVQLIWQIAVLTAQ